MSHVRFQLFGDTAIMASEVRFVRIADIDVHRSEGLLRSVSFESERYGPQTHHVDCRAF